MATITLNKALNPTTKSVLTVTESSRTATKTKLNLKAVTNLGSSSSYAGTGITLKGTVKVSGTGFTAQSKVLTLKSSSEYWSGTTTHTTTSTFEVEIPAAVTDITITYTCAWSDTGNSMSGSTSMSLSKLASVLGKISTFDVESTLTMSITKYVDSYYDVLEVYDENENRLWVYYDVEDGYSFSLTGYGIERLYNVMQNQTHNFTFKFSTYSDSNYTNLVGESEQVVEGYITNASPLFTDYDLEDLNYTTYELTNDLSTIIKGYSSLRISNLQATPLKGASISYWIVNDTSYANTGSNAILLEKYSTNSVTVYVQDSRKFTTPLTKTITNFVNYFKLTKGVQNIERVDDVTEQTKISFQGTFFNDKFGSNTNAVQNALEVTYKYKITQDSNWTTGQTSIVPTVSGNNYSFEGLILGDTNNGFDIANSYDIKVIVKDKLEEAEFTYQLIAGKPAMALFGNKVALGDKYNEELSDYDVQLWGNVYLKDEEVDTHFKNLLGDYVIEQGISDIWQYRKWASGVSECWTIEYIDSGTHTMSANGNIYASSTHEYAFPTDLFIDTPILSANVQQGGGMWAKATGSTKKDKAVIGFLRSNNSTDSISFNMIAKGYWK